MSQQPPLRARGVKVLKAVSSPLRLLILNLLFDKGALTYTELMNHLKMSPSRDAGRFAYHLKFLLKANLVEVDSNAKKYFLTDLGKMVLDVADRVEKKAVKPKDMMVRTSHFTLEEFDANKIATSLIREAKMPPDLAQKIAKETEKFLIKSKIKYLTSPLIREIVNALLIEKGLEDYRHKLTRVGLPIHEVSSLIESKEPANFESILSTAGKTVFREYALLSVFPRDIADAHVSGALHLNGLSTWILKPNEVTHDLRFFLQNGLKLANIYSQHHSEQPPENFEAALAMVFNVLLLVRHEVNETQTVEFFNLFLAPYIKGLDPVKVKENLRLLILNLNQHVDATLGLVLTVPKFIGEKPAIGQNGKTFGKYTDFEVESKLIASLLIEIYTEESNLKPLLNPKLAVKISGETTNDENAKAILTKAHALAADRGTVYFANLIGKEENISYSASGVKLEANLTEDWETDTLRTGCLGYVTVNMPRIVRETEKDKAKFFEILKERCELSARALGIKYRSLKQYGKTAFPFLMQGTNGDTYFRLENCTGVINFAGLKEAVESFTGKIISDKESILLTEEIVKTTKAYIHKIGRKHGKRLFPAVLRSLEASGRLAQLDVEKYGVAKVKFSGMRETPFFSTTRRMQLQKGNFLYLSSEQLDTETSLKGLNEGGALFIVEMGNIETQAEDLMKLTLHLMEKHEFGFLIYNRSSTYCYNCRKNWFGTLRKCPSCGSVGTLVSFDKFKNT
jgi:anaerobic ribonucleoside-triphosphate reductase